MPVTLNVIVWVLVGALAAALDAGTLGDCEAEGEGADDDGVGIDLGVALEPQADNPAARRPTVTIRNISHPFDCAAKSSVFMSDGAEGPQRNIPVA